MLRNSLAGSKTVVSMCRNDPVDCAFGEPAMGALAADNLKKANIICYIYELLSSASQDSLETPDRSLPRAISRPTEAGV